MLHIDRMPMLKKYTTTSLMLFVTTLNYTQHVNADTQLVNEVNVLKEVPIRWRRAPNIQFQPGDLEGRPRSVDVLMDADSTGKITSAIISKSSGLTDLDDMVIQAVKKARLTPYIKSGIRYPVRVMQPFNFKTDDYSSTLKSIKKIPIRTCMSYFEPEGFQRKQSDQHSPFQYKEIPEMKLPMTESKAKEFSIHFKFNLDRKNRISDIHLIRSSNEIFALFLLNQFATAKIEAPRKFYQIFKFQFEEKIELKKIQCN